MAKNKINDLRDHLFETIEALKDPEKPMDVARAHAISEIAQTIINSAKVEVELVRAVDGARACSQFFDLKEESREIPKRLASPNGNGHGDARSLLGSTLGKI